MICLCSTNCEPYSHFTTYYVLNIPEVNNCAIMKTDCPHKNRPSDSGDFV